MQMMQSGIKILTLILAVLVAPALFHISRSVAEEVPEGAAVESLSSDTDGDTDGDVDGADAEVAFVDIGELFGGEERHYAMSFWVLDDVAFGTLTMESDGNGRYLAILKAQTTGVIGWITRYRKDTYRELMEVTENGRRFRTVTFDKDVDIGGKKRNSHTEIDYATGRMEWKEWKKGELVDEDGIDMEDGAYYDGPLTGFYNFRYGVYGAIEEGSSYNVRTFPKSRGREVDILIKLATADDFHKRYPERNDFTFYLADVNLDKDLFDSKSGDVELMFTEEMALVEAVAKDIVLFGDIRSKLIDEDRLSEIEK